MNKKFIDVLLFSFLFLGVIIIIYFFFTKGTMCMKDPLIYGAKEKRVGNIDFECSCSWNVPISPTIMFNSTDLWNLNKNITYNITL